MRERLVGFTLPRGALPLEGAQVVRDGRPAGRVTSARASERLGERDRPRLGAAGPGRGRHRDPDPDRRQPPHSRTVTLAPFYDPKGELLRS